MSKVPLCLVGCGGMGWRHVAGYAALERSGHANFDLVAVCDIRKESALGAAEEAERLLGRRPAVHTSLEGAIADSSLVAFDIVTEAWTHQRVALPLLEAGRHVCCEKPLALTIKSGRVLQDAARRNGVVLAVAENYRRDPPNRLAKAAIEAGLVGYVHLMTQYYAGGDDRIIITPWRHMKNRGSIALDMGCHITDIVQYYLGPFESMFGTGFIAEPVRRRRDAPGNDTPAARARWQEMPERVEPTGEDSFIALYRMQSGVRAQVTYLPSGPGRRWFQRIIHGRDGSLEVPRDRRGGDLVVHRASGSLDSNGIRAELKDFELDPVTTALFGGEVAYSRPFEESDAALIAIELFDFVEAIRQGRPPEVDADLGMTAVASVLGAFESEILGRPVTMAEILSGAVSAYQDSIDEELGL